MNNKNNAVASQAPESSLLSSGCFLDYVESGQLVSLTEACAFLPRHLETAPEVAMRCVAAPRLFVALDYDGTLASIATRPDEARPPAVVLQLLSRLVQTSGIKVAIVSGRPLADLRALLPVPGVAYIGTHGLEVCTAEGEQTSLLLAGAFSRILTRLREQIANSITDVPGVYIENKGQALAVHYRLAQPETAERVVAQFHAAVRRYQEKGVALEVLQGNKVMEVYPVGVNKGKAVELLLRLSDPTPLPLYLGDDVTDESAFRTLNRRGVTILVADPPHRTTAHYHLRNPAEVWWFLTRLVEARHATPSVC